MSEAHGYVPYTHGCRCPVCRLAKADYMRSRRANGRRYAQALTRLPSGERSARHSAFDPGAARAVAQGVTHGTRAAYEERGCRCRECTTARVESDRRKRGSRS